MSEFEDIDNDQVIVKVGDFTFSLSTAENDFNESKRCLFATLIWSGAKVLSDYLISLDCDKIQSKRVIEFGAAAGLPSLTCHHMGSSIVCASDFPSPAVLQNLKDNIDRNMLLNGGSIGVIPHKWGENADSLLSFNSGDLYDVVIAAECLWHHSFHAVFVQSINAVLRPGGTAYITFSHHVPGVEKEDLRFFETAAQSGLQVVSQQTFSAPHMWKDQSTAIFLYELVKNEKSDDDQK